MIKVWLYRMGEHKRNATAITLIQLWALSLLLAWGLRLWSSGNTATVVVPNNPALSYNIGNWQQDSEALVWGRVMDAKRAGLFSSGCFLRRWTKTDNDLFIKDEVPEEKPKKYYSQSGLQGTITAAAAMLLSALHISNGTIIKILHLVNTALFIMVLLLLCRWLGKELGWVAALAGFAGTMCYSWVAVSVPNLYWVTWTILLPTVLTAYWARCVRGGQQLPLGGSLVFGDADAVSLRV